MSSVLGTDIKLETTPIVGCTCDEWQVSWPQIEKLQIEAYKKGQKYTGSIIKFCPWCGQQTKVLNA